MSRMNEAGGGEGSGGQGGTTEQLRNSAQQVGENIRDMGSQMRDAAAERFNQLRDQASQYYQDGRQRAEEWERGLEEYVQEKPIQSLLIAAGVGLLLGILWKRS